MYSGKMKIKRFELVNAADGWPCHVVCVDREQGGKMVRTWSTDGQQLEVVEGEHYPSLVLPGTKTSFVMPDADEGDGYTPQ